MSNTPEVAWVNAPDATFAEVAEVLGIKTTLILAVYKVDDMNVRTIWTPVEDEERFLAVHLRRDRDGILRYASLPVEVPNFAEDLRRSIERKMGDL